MGIWPFLKGGSAPFWGLSGLVGLDGHLAFLEGRIWAILGWPKVRSWKLCLGMQRHASGLVGLVGRAVLLQEMICAIFGWGQCAPGHLATAKQEPGEFTGPDAVWPF